MLSNKLVTLTFHHSSVFCVSNAELGIIIGLFSGSYFNPGCNGVPQYLCSQMCGETNFRIAYSSVFDLVTTHTLIFLRGSEQWKRSSSTAQTRGLTKLRSDWLVGESRGQSQSVDGGAEKLPGLVVS